MGNTLTGLIPVLYEALDVVSRELVGYIPAVSRDSTAERAAVGEPVRVPVAPVAETHDITPGTNAEDNGDQTVGYVDMTISKAKYSPVRWTGEEQRGLANSGQLNAITRDRFAQSMRALVNEVEADLAQVAHLAACRAYGTAGTTPFASDLSDLAQIKKILDDNGAPQNDRHMILSTTAGAKMRTLTQLTKVNESGDQTMLRQGVLLDIFGFSLRESAKASSHTKGTGTGYLTNLASALAAGSTAISVDTGSGTILAGDVLALEGDANKYVVNAALSAGSLSIANPGLLVALADGKTVTVGGSYAANVGFCRSAIQLVTRAPAMPIGPDGRPIDAADDIMELTDPISGLTFQVVMYRQYRQLKYEIGLAWGQKATKPEHIALLLG